MLTVTANARKVWGLYALKYRFLPRMLLYSRRLPRLLRIPNASTKLVHYCVKSLLVLLRLSKLY